MKEENKKSKKKILLYYLILAACLLVIAAVTVTVVFTVGNKAPVSMIDKEQPGDDINDDDKPTVNPGEENPGEEQNPGEENPPEQPTTNPTGYVLPVSNASVTLGYEFAYDVTLDNYRVHQGMDFECNAGDNVFAVLDGTVSQIVKGHKLGENYVSITHSNGVVSTYKYIEAADNLSVGMSVKRGEVIGTVQEAQGMEMNQGDHLHFVITVNGKTADPDTYLNVINK